MQLKSVFEALQVFYCNVMKKNVSRSDANRCNLLSMCCFDQNNVLIFNLFDTIYELNLANHNEKWPL